MIDPHTIVFAAVGFLAKTGSNAVAQWQPSSQDTQRLAEGMAKFKTERREFHTAAKTYTKNIYPFEKYAVSKEIIKINDAGQIEIGQLEEWKNLTKTWDLLKWQENRDMEKLFAAFPEQEVEYNEKLEGIKSEIRAMLGGMDVHNSIVFTRK